METYGCRWTGTETFHRDGKQAVSCLTRRQASGLVDSQLRDAKGQTRHIYMVFLAHSLLTLELGTNPNDWTSVKMTTIGEGCRELLRESLRKLIEYVVSEIKDIVYIGRNIPKAMTRLLHRLGLVSVRAR